MNWLGVQANTMTRTQITRLDEIFPTMASKTQFADEALREELLRQQVAAILPDQRRRLVTRRVAAPCGITARKAQPVSHNLQASLGLNPRAGRPNSGRRGL